MIQSFVTIPPGYDLLPSCPHLLFKMQVQVPGAGGKTFGRYQTSEYHLHHSLAPAPDTCTCTLFSWQVRLSQNANEFVSKFILPYWGLTESDFGFLNLSNASLD
jgi:hypothetical protein